MRSTSPPRAARNRLRPSLTASTLLTAALLACALPTHTAAQLHPGDFIRIRTATDSSGWHSGRILAISANEVHLRTGEPQVTFRIADITAVQQRRKNSRRMLTGGLLGAAGGAVLGTLIPTAAEVPDQDKLGYAFAATAGGALVGTAGGSGRTGRGSLLVGAGAGFVLGSIILSGACESDSPKVICPLVYGGGFGTIFGIVIGSGVGLILPNWVTVEGLGARLSF